MPKLLPTLSTPSTASVLRGVGVVALLALPLMLGAGEAPDPLKGAKDTLTKQTDNIIWIIRFVGIAIVAVGGVFALLDAKKKNWLALGGWVALVIFGIIVVSYAEAGFNALKG